MIRRSTYSTASACTSAGSAGCAPCPRWRRQQTAFSLALRRIPILPATACPACLPPVPPLPLRALRLPMHYTPPHCHQLSHTGSCVRMDTQRPARSPATVLSVLQGDPASSVCVTPGQARTPQCVHTASPASRHAAACTTTQPTTELLTDSLSRPRPSSTSTSVPAVCTLRARIGHRLSTRSARSQRRTQPGS